MEVRQKCLDRRLHARDTRISLSFYYAMSELRVLTLNCWGLRFFSKLRKERLAAISDRLADTHYDVIALQEIWVESQDWQYMRAVCGDRYPYGKFFLTGAFGSGLAIMTRYPIVSMETHMFRLTGTPIYVQEGDWIAGKACGRITMAHPQLGLVDVYTSHVRSLTNVSHTLFC